MTLRNSTELKPVLHNDTRWSGKFYLLKRFGEIKTGLLKACEDEVIATPQDYEGLFSAKALRYQKMLETINVITLKLQTKGCTLSECHCALNTLLQAVDEEKGAYVTLIWVQF